jgi:UDP-N-acetylglucosamine 1-carboxyvinyltransferase
MDKMIIQGNIPLRGTVRVRGAKNATLPLMAASLLAEEGWSILHNVPCLHDVFSMEKLLMHMGAKTEFNGTTMTISAESGVSPEAPYDLVRKMRASFFVLGPLLARFGKAKVSLPGGCAIGTRPVDIHLKGLAALGADIQVESGYILARGALCGTEFTLDFPSVGATENLMMAATLAKGVTILANVAQEPEIVDLASFLNAMGARVQGAGTSTITIEGVTGLHGAEYTVMNDRIEAGTFLLAAVGTRGCVTVQGINPGYLRALLDKLREAGTSVITESNQVTVDAGSTAVTAVDVLTTPYPGFPTDLQAQFMAVMTTAQGISRITETVFENRFMQAAELARMGADITIDGNTAIVRGVESLSGAEVMASDLRASAALIIAGLMAKRGQTVVHRVYHLDRGYERIEERLAYLGASIQRVRE